MITREVDGFKMFLDPTDGGISKALANKGAREPCFMWILQNEADGGLGLDVGANIGYTTLYLCRAMDKVIAVEPDPRSRKLLIKNIEANGFNDKTEIYDFAVSDRNGSQTICFADTPNLSTLCETARMEGQMCEVQTRTIDSLDVVPNFIKMDIEGSELTALQGAEETLRTLRPKLAISLYHRIDDFIAIPDYLNKLGLGYEFFLDHFTIHREETVLFASPTVD